MIILVLLLISLASPLSASVDCSNPAACTVTCDGTNDHTDINSAISSATQDTTIQIGSGSCQINGIVTLNRRVTLAGNGFANTTFSGTADPIVRIQHGSTGFARLTGIHINDSNTTIGIEVLGTITQVRIDHMKITVNEDGIQTNGAVEGVYDNNEMINCDRCFMTIGAQHTGWTTDFSTYSGGSGTGNFTAGGSHALFIETNTLTRNASFTGSNEFHYAQEGARTVFRYNTINATAYTTTIQSVWDSHGNQFYYSEASDFRGNPIMEVYENTFNFHRAWWVFQPRSGSVLIWNNTINMVDTSEGLEGLVRIWEEEASSGSGEHFTGKYDYVWPTEDMITNTFIWGNTINGSAFTTANIIGAQSAACCEDYPDAGVVINYNRDVWLHAPQSSGGRTYYDDRPGASGRNADGTLVFTTSGANAYYPYAPYTYPHPLRNEVSGSPAKSGGGTKHGGGAKIGDE